MRTASSGDPPGTRSSGDSTIVHTTVKSDEGRSETQPAGPSPTDPTRTSAPLVSPQPVSARPSMAPQLRDHARYDILGEHGRGGLGRVSRAHDRELGRDIAIKELISRGQLSEMRFLREALITARLEHPGIVPVYEAGRWSDGTPFYAMKLVAGRPLRDLILERKTVDERIGLLHHVIAVADAIAYAHGRNIIHRDLKPSNVIVGDFGETVVIDWGLAKDLNADETSTPACGPFRTSHDDGLTSTGTILGTPAYMAPEQARGEQVDQRADVFAIGTMLWELCTLEKLPPAYTARRRRILRHAGIDQDLATIIEKAVAPDPADRYRDAANFAADLKAFKAGAHIAARRYSLFATVMHWTRRNRSLATAVLGGLILLLAGGALYLRNITAERNRADEANQATALKNAELLLASDPSAAWDALTKYAGPDAAQVRLLKAKAIGLGIATFRTSAHRESVARLQPLSNGRLLSLSFDGSICTTTVDGQATLRASNAIGHNLSAWSPARELLAYPCHPEGICFFATSTAATPPRIPDARIPSSLSFSRDGRRLAARYEAQVVVWDVDNKDARKLYEITAPDAKQIFYTSDSLIIATARQIGHIDPASNAFVPLIDFAVSIAAWDEDDLIVGNTRGDVMVLPSSDLQHKAVIKAACNAAINSVAIGHDSQLFAYGCQDGDVGARSLSNPDKLSVRLHHDTAVLSVALSQGHPYLIQGDQRGAMHVYDFMARRTTVYHGQPTRVLRVSGPTRSFPYFASADDDGYIRLWPPPSDVPRTILQTPYSLFDTALLDDGTVVGVGRDPQLQWWRDGASGTLPGQEAGALGVRSSPDLRHFATFGFSGELILWSTRPLAEIRRMSPGPITNVIFLNDGQTVVSSGQDGKLLLWRVDDAQPRLLAKFAQPLASVEIVRSKDQLVVADRGGSLWLVDPRWTSNTEQKPVQLRVGNGKAISHLMVSDNGEWICIGTTDGEVLRYPTTTYIPNLLLKAGGTIHVIVYSSDRSMIAVVSEDGHVFLLDAGSASVPSPAHWHKLRLAARNARFSPDGKVLAITTNNDGVYFYSIPQGDWQYFPFPSVDVFRGRFSRNGTRYAAVDGGGNLTLFDMDALAHKGHWP